MNIQFTNIIYNGPSKKELQQLPTTIVMNDEYRMADWIEFANDDEATNFSEYIISEGLAADYISDETGWMVESFDVEYIPSNC